MVQQMTGHDYHIRQIYKIANDESRDYDASVRFGRDIFNPGLKRLPGTIGGALVGAGVGTVAGKATGNTQLGQSLGATAGAALANGHMRQKALNSLNERYFGEPASKGEIRRLHAPAAIAAAAGLGTKTLRAKGKHKILTGDMGGATDIANATSATAMFAPAGIINAFKTPESIIQHKRKKEEI